MAKRQRVAIIYNPAAGRRRRRKLLAVIRALRDRGCRVRLVRSRAAGDAETRAAEVAATMPPPDVIVAAGGDGTVNEVVNGLGDTDIPLAVIPLGTINLLAREFAIRATAPALADMICDGAERPIWPAFANDRRFVVTAGIGVDARAVDEVDANLKRVVGRLAYAWAGIRAWLGPRSTYQVEIDGVTAEAGWVLAAKGRFYAGGISWAPAARADGPLLYIGRLAPGGRLATVRALLAMVCGWRALAPDWRVDTARTVRVSGASGEPVQLDGDIGTALPVTLSVAERPITLLVP